MRDIFTRFHPSMREVFSLYCPSMRDFFNLTQILWINESEVVDPERETGGPYIGCTAGS